MNLDSLFDGSDAHELCSACGGTGRVYEGERCKFCAAAIYDRCKIVEQRKPDMYEELKARLLAWCETSNCFGLDSIGKDVAQSLDAIEKLERQLAERDAEIAKYRDAPVVAYRHLMEDGWGYFDAPTGDDCPKCVPLIVKPGEQ